MKKIFLLFLSVFFLVLLGVYFSLPYFLSKDKATVFIQKQISESLKSDVSFEALKVSVLPRIAIDVTGLHIPEFQIKTEEETGAAPPLKASIQADSIRFNLSYRDLLLLKVSLSNLSFESLQFRLSKLAADEEIQLLSLSELKGNISSLDFKERIQFEFIGKLFDMEEKIDLKGGFLYKPATGKLNFLRMEFRDLKDLSLDRLKELLAYFQSPVLPVSGTLSGDVVLELKNELLQVDIGLSGQAIQYAYLQNMEQVTSDPFDCDISGRFLINYGREKYEFEDLQINLGNSSLRLDGYMRYSNFEQYELTVYSKEIDLVALPEIFPPLKDQIPEQLALAGSIGCDLHMKSSNTKMSVKGTMILDHTQFEVPSYFAKPAEMPTEFNFQIHSDDKQTYQGDFNLKLEGMNLKASLSEFSIDTKKANINLLTNNFQLENISHMLQDPKLQKLTGMVKLIGNFEIPLEEIEEMKYQGNLVWKDGSYQPSEAVGMTDIDVELLFLNNKISASPFSFLVNDQLAEGNLEVTWAPEFICRGSVKADYLDLSFLDDLLIKNQTVAKPRSSQVIVQSIPKNLSAEQPVFFLPENPFEMREIADDYVDSNLKINVGKLKILDNDFENITIDVLGSDRYIQIKEAKLDLWGGQVSLLGDALFEDQIKTVYPLEKLQMGLTLDQVDPNHAKGVLSFVKEYLIGGVTLRTNLTSFGVSQDEVLQNLEGQGEVYSENGRIQKLDFMQILSLFQMFLSFESESKGFTEFDTLSSRFHIEKGSLISDEIKIQTPHYDVDGIGSVSFEKMLNYRLQIILSPFLSKKISPFDLAGARIKVPLLINGSLEEPKFSYEPIQGLVNNVVKQGLGNLLGELTRGASSAKQNIASASERSQPIS